MRNIPQLNEYSVSKENIEEFKGLDHNERTQIGEWYDMENMSCDDYPVAATRKKREIISKNDSNEYEINDRTLKTDSTIIDACKTGDGVVLLKNAVLSGGDSAATSGKILTDADGELVNISKKEYVISNARYKDLWWEFEKNYMFFSKNELLCTIFDRQYRLTNSVGDDAEMGAIAAIVAVPNTDGGGKWVFPLVLSKTKEGCYFTYRDSGMTEWSCEHEDYSPESIPITDSYGCTWYTLGNVTARATDYPTEAIDSAGGKAQYIGYFDSVDIAVSFLLSIYYDEYYANYNHFWGYSPLMKYPCDRSDNKQAWADAFGDDVAAKARKESEVFMAYRPKFEDGSSRECIINFPHYFYEDGDYEGVYNLTQYEDTEEWKAAFNTRLNAVLEKLKNIFCLNYQGSYHSVEKYIFLIIEYPNYGWTEIEISVNFEFLILNNGADIYKEYITPTSFFVPYSYKKKNGSSEINKWAFYVGGKKSMIYCTDRISSVPWTLDEDNNITVIITQGSFGGITAPSLGGSTSGGASSGASTDNLSPPYYPVAAAVSGSLSEDIIGALAAEVTSDTNTVSSALGLNEKVNTTFAHYPFAENTYYLGGNINPTYIYYGQKANDSAENLSIYLNKNGYNVDDVENTLELFDKYEDKREMISSGSKILIIPDGIIIDNKSGKNKKISCEKGINATISNIYDGNVITLDDTYRYVQDMGIQKHINQSGFEWTNITTSVRLSTGSEDLSEYFAAGDVLEVTITKIPTAVEKAGIFKDNKQYLKVSKLLTENSSHYIEFENTYAAGSYSNVSVYFHLARKFPSAELGCESQNRIWLAQDEGHEIYASALGDPSCFYDYSGLTTDSYAVNVGTNGKFTGVVNYMGTPLFFKEDALHIVSGSMPSEYYVTTYTDFKGCEDGSQNSFAVINNILYYKSPFGIVAYDGSNTALISDALGNVKYKNGIGGALGNKYYISLYNTDEMKREMFCYDTIKGMWTKENDETTIKLISNNSDLMCITANQILNITKSDSASTVTENDFDWFAETGTYGYSYPNKKYISRFQIRMFLEKGSTADFYIQYNSDGVWYPCGAQITGNGIRSFLFPIRPQRCDHMKLKIAGKGKAKIYSITKLLEEGGDI